MSTGDSIIPPPPWFDETPQPSSIHEDVLPPVPSFDVTPFVRAPVPETPTIPSMAKRWRSGTLHPVPETPTINYVAKRWRSGTLHLENPVSKRWRSDTLHPETPVPTTTPLQLRVLCVHFEDSETQSDPSERVKRSRLAPAQVMTTTVAKHGDWSLDFDERGPVFDGAEDWSHSVFLTGRAGRKEVYFASESPENHRLLLAAIEREWKKWKEHKATLPFTQGELRMLKSRFPNLKIVGTRWVLTPKEPDFKARLVVQGCQEDPSMMRTDSPTGSRDSCFLVLSCATEHWSCGSADAASAYLQAGGISRLLLLMMPKRQPPPGCEPGEVRVARGSIYGTCDASRSWYQHLRDKLASKFRVHEIVLEKGLSLSSSMVGSPLSRSPMSMICSTRMTLVTKPPSRCWMPL